MLTKYEPMNFLNRMQADLNDFFRTNGNRLEPAWFDDTQPLLSADWVPSVDLKENDKQFVINVDVPGVDPKDIEVSMENGFLSIKGERKQENEEEKDNIRVQECFYGNFERRFRMPDTADANQIKAKNNHGTLAITIAKKAGAKPRRIEISS